MPKQPERSNLAKWNLIIDVANSVHANNCILAAKDEYVGNDFPGYSAPLPDEGGDIMTVTRKIRGETPLVDTAYLLQMCNHCDNGPCQKVGGDAVRKRPDGIVIIDPVKAKGRKDIVEACPYGAVIWNEELQLPQHWTFDAHLLDDGWTQPRCVDVSPKGAIEAVKISDTQMEKRAKAEGLEALRPELGTQPRVYYRNLDRFTKCFIGGTLIAAVDGFEQCVENASITLFQSDREIGSTQSDAYGEFKLDGLDPNSGAYQLEISHPKYGDLATDAHIGTDSVYLAELLLHS
ncbi:MAG: 4Fe-4S dicluster domain-containing protein [Pseudomonadota bacterium]